MGLLSKLFGMKDVANSEIIQKATPEKTYAIVELKSPNLLAFDIPAEGVKYQIPDFKPGNYKIPLDAIVKATDSGQTSENKFIEVDTGIIYFIDADYEENFRKLEEELFEETGDSYGLVENPEDFTDKVGIKYDCLVAPGIGSGYDFEGDGTYIIEISKIDKI